MSRVDGIYTKYVNVHNSSQNLKISASAGFQQFLLFGQRTILETIWNMGGTLGHVALTNAAANDYSLSVSGAKEIIFDWHPVTEGNCNIIVMSYAPFTLSLING